MAGAAAGPFFHPKSITRRAHPRAWPRSLAHRNRVPTTLEIKPTRASRAFLTLKRPAANPTVIITCHPAKARLAPPLLVELSLTTPRLQRLTAVSSLATACGPFLAARAQCESPASLEAPPATRLGTSPLAKTPPRMAPETVMAPEGAFHAARSTARPRGQRCRQPLKSLTAGRPPGVKKPPRVRGP